MVYHEAKMVAYRGGHGGPGGQGCASAGRVGGGGGGGPGSHSPAEMSTVPVTQHLTINLQPVNNVSMHYGNNNARKHEHLSVHYPNGGRAHTHHCPHAHHRQILHLSRADCYHASGAAGGAYMPPGTPGAAQNNPQGGMRVQPSQQPPSQQQQQQDLSKAAMQPQHSFVPGQGQNAPRAQFSNFPYRSAQHSTRNPSHPRQQQPQYIPGAAASGTAPVMYSTLLFQPTPMSIPQSFQQPRSQGYYPYMTPYLPNYSTPGHTTSFFYQSGMQQMQPPNLAPNAPGRNNGNNLVGPQGAPATPSAPNTPLQHPGQTPAHMHPSMPGVRPAPTKRTHRLPIIDPATQQDIFSGEIYSDNSHASGENSERQTPQPEHPPTNSASEEFTRMVFEAAKTPSEVKPKVVDIRATISSPIPVQINVPLGIASSNVIKTDVLESKSITHDTIEGPSETPVVSAITDSPVIVPKLPINIKQSPKPCEPIPPPSVVDINKMGGKQQKTSLSKPIVPQSCVEGEAAVAEGEAQAPLPQRVPRDRARSEDMDKEPDTPALKPNGPTQTLVSSKPELVKNSPSQANTEFSHSQDTIQQTVLDNKLSCEAKTNSISKSELDLATPPTELLAATIEKAAQDKLETESNEEIAVIEAQAKLTQSLASCLRPINSDSNMKDINLNNTTTDSDTANGNAPTEKEDANKNEKAVKNAKNQSKKSMNNNATNDAPENDADSYENGKVETDKISNVEAENSSTTNEENVTADAPAADFVFAVPAVPPVFVPKYKYSDDQWSPMNKTGKKSYDLSFLKQIKDHPMSKTKPDAPLLEQLKVVRETQSFTPISRPINDSLLPPFVKAGVSRSTSRDPKKDGARSMQPSGKGSLKLTPSSSGSGTHKPVIHVSIREDVKLNKSENAWKPTRLKKDVNIEEEQAEDLYKKFRGILNKLTPQKFDTLMEKVKLLQINNQKSLQGVINLVFEKAIEEPNFSEAYALMCHKLSKLMVPADNATSPEQYVNFKGLIIGRCQNQFVADKTDETVMKLEKDLAECKDPVRKKELLLMYNEESRRIRMRSVGNVRFIGELYKLKMLTSKIMFVCMNHLIEHLDEEKLECLCKLITTIGQQVEGEAKEPLDAVFKKMQDIVDRKSNKISSRVRFMIQDVIELRGRKWVTKNVVDLQPKMMDQIQKEADQQQRHIELMNSSSMGGFRRDDGGRNKQRGDGGRRQGGGGGGGGGGSMFADNNWKHPKSYSVDTSKLKAVSATNKNLSNIKLAPHFGWNYGSGAKSTAQTASNSLLNLPTTNNKYSVLAENIPDPSTLRGIKDSSPSYHSKGASIERSTFNSKPDFAGGSNRSGSSESPRQPLGSRSTMATTSEVPPPPAALAQEPLTQAMEKSVKSMVDLYLLHDEATLLRESVADIQELFPQQYHAAVVTEILNNSFERSPKVILTISKMLTHLTSTNTISAANFLEGLSKVIEIASDLYIDIPMLDDYLAKICAPQIEKKIVTFADVWRISDKIISLNHGHLFLKGLIENLKESMGPSFVKSKWQESGLEFKQWMNEDEVDKFIQDNKFEFLEGGAKASDEIRKILSPLETQQKLLQLLNSDESCECIRGWVQDNLGKASNEDWFIRALIQAICEHAIYGPGGRDVPHFKQERMNKYSSLIHEFGESKQSRDSSCLFGIQQLIHRLEHPQGLTLEIFQYLNDQYIISVDSFISWETSEKEPEGKAVMLKALTSFFTNIKEADNEDSCSEG